MRKENRANGFNFEDVIIERHGLIPSDSYTHRWDAFTKSGVPVSIKTVGDGHELGFGNIFRQSSIKEPFFYLIVGVWSESEDYVDDVYAVKIETSKWNEMFDMETIERLRTLISWAKQGRFNGNQVHLWHTLRKQANKRWAKYTPNIMRLRLRIINKHTTGANKDRFRPQCAMMSHDFIKHFIDSDDFYSVKSKPVDLSALSAKNSPYDEVYHELFEEDNDKEIEEDNNKNLFDISGLDIDTSSNNNKENKPNLDHYTDYTN